MCLWIPFIKKTTFISEYIFKFIYLFIKKKKGHFGIVVNFTLLDWYIMSLLCYKLNINKINK